MTLKDPVRPLEKAGAGRARLRFTARLLGLLVAATLFYSAAIVGVFLQSGILEL